jgi:hypothetical protein
MHVRIPGCVRMCTARRFPGPWPGERPFAGVGKENARGAKKYAGSPENLSGVTRAGGAGARGESDS